MRPLRIVAVASAAVVAVAGTSGPAQSTGRRQVVLVVTSGLSYEAALDDPLLEGISGAGGIGLMTASGAHGPVGAAMTLGAGRGAGRAPAGPVPFEANDGGVTVQADRYRGPARPAEAGLLGSALASAGRTVGYVDLGGARGSPAMLAAMDERGRIPVAFLNEFPSLGDLPPEFLLPGAAQPVEEADLVVTPDPDAVPFLLESSPADEVLVIVVVASPSDDMRAEGDTVTPIVMAGGAPPGLAAQRPGGLTSDTTSREGVVSVADVAPTVLRFLGVPVPPEMVGSPIRVEGDPPTALHARFLEWRRIATPVGLAALFLALGSLIGGAILGLGPWRIAGRTAGVAGATGLASLAALVALVPLGWLPSLEAPPVIAVLLAVGLVVLGAGLRAGRSAPTRAVALVGAAGVAVVVLDAALGWRSGLTPFLGGSALDGVRFFGLGNPYAGMVLGGAVLAAGVLPRPTGAWLLVLAALFAGLPFLGADLGGGVTLAFAAGLWAGADRWGRFGVSTWAAGAAAAVVALVVLVLAHRLFPSAATHVVRAVGGPDGAAGAVDIFWRRLELNLRTTSATPAAWLAVLGLPGWLIALLRPPARLRAFLEANRRWGAALVTLAASGIVGYVVNDTYGTATIAFLFLSAGVIVPVLLERVSPRTPATARTAG